uniref:DNA binding protein n=1 Tax=Dulem virus 206 TaxID=3145683 RepID=A0AAU8B7T0_9VIRU
MAHRKSVSPAKDKKVFTNTAKKVKKINVNPKPSRGGIRL